MGITGSQRSGQIVVVELHTRVPLQLVMDKMFFADTQDTRMTVRIGQTTHSRLNPTELGHPTEVSFIKANTLRQADGTCLTEKRGSLPA